MTLQHPLRILSVEDDPNDAELIRDLLETEDIACEITRVDTQPEFKARLERGELDLILADYTLPSFDGISALKLALATCPQIPFIFVSGTLGEVESAGICSPRGGRPQGMSMPEKPFLRKA